MTQSTNYGFNLPTAEDFADIDDLTDNWSSLDEELKRVDDKAGAISYNSTTETINVSATVGTYDDGTIIFS